MEIEPSSDAIRTEWRNPQLQAAGLPRYRDVEFESVAEKYRRYTLLTTLLFFLPPIVVVIAVFIFVGDIPLPVAFGVPAALVVLTILIAVYRWADAGHRGWALRDHDLIARSGIFWRQITILPVARIQHVESTHGPIERGHGLARLKLFTAGGMTADLVVIGLARDEADRLREHLVEEIRRRDARLSEVREKSAAEE